MSNRARRTVTVAATLAAGILLATACGGGGSTKSGPGAIPPGGVTVSDLGGGWSGPTGTAAPGGGPLTGAGLGGVTVDAGGNVTGTGTMGGVTGTAKVSSATAGTFRFTGSGRTGMLLLSTDVGSGRKYLVYFDNTGTFGAWQKNATALAPTYTQADVLTSTWSGTATGLAADFNPVTPGPFTGSIDAAGSFTTSEGTGTNSGAIALVDGALGHYQGDFIRTTPAPNTGTQQFLITPDRRLLAGLSCLGPPYNVPTQCGLSAWQRPDPVASAVQYGGPAWSAPDDVASFPDGSCVVVGDTDIWSPSQTALVLKYDAAGALLWQRSPVSTGNTSAGAVAGFPDGSCVVLGLLSAAATFGSGETNETTISTFPGSYLARYNTDGSLAWATPGATSGGGGTAPAAFANGTFVVGGAFEGTVTFGAGEPNETPLTSAGGRDYYVAWHNADGTLAYVRRDGGPGDEGSPLNWFDGHRELVTFPDGSVLLAGTFGGGSATFGASEANETALTSAKADESFIARYASDRTLDWARSDPGGDYSFGTSAAAYAGGSFVVTSRFTGTVTFGSGDPNETIETTSGNDASLAKYSANGELIWVATTSGGNGSGLYEPVTFPDGSCVVLGGIYGVPVVFGSGEANETTLSGPDGCRVRYNADGSLAWAFDIEAWGDVGTTIAAYIDGSFVVASDFTGTVVFGPGTSNEVVLTSPNPVEDIYVVQFPPDGVFR